MSTKLYDNLTVVDTSDLSSDPGAAAKVLQTTSAGLITLLKLALKGQNNLADRPLLTMLNPQGTYGWIHTVDETVDGDYKLYRYLNSVLYEVINYARANGDITFAAGLDVATRVNVGTGHTLSSDGTTRLRAHSAAGGLIHWAMSGIAGTAKTIIPNGTGDVTSLAFVTSIAVPSTGTPTATHTSVAPGASILLWDNGVNTLTLSVAADGSMTIQRTAGTYTFTVSLLILLV